MQFKKSEKLRKIGTLVLLAVFICNAGFVSAQKKKKKPKDEDESHEYDYTMIRNTPDDVSKLTISLYPLVFPINMSYGGTALTLAAGAGGSYDINEKITANADLSYSYLNYNEATESKSNSTSWYNFEIGGTYYFSNEIKEKTEQVYITYSGNTRYFLKLPVDRVRKFGARAAFILQNSEFSSEAATPGQLAGYDINDPQQTKVDFANDHRFNFSDIHTNVTEGVFAFGLMTEKVTDYDMKFVNDYGERSVSTKNQFYLDLLVAPFISYGNASIFMPAHDSIGDKTVIYNLDKYSTKVPIGARLGFTFNNLKPFGGSRSFELGYMPNSGAYILFKVGMAINPKHD